jgi:hypothetical protein
MFTHNFSVGKTRAVSLVLVLGLIMGALSLTGCNLNDDGDDTGDGLISGLKGTWKGAFDWGEDIYTITANTLAESGSGAMAVFNSNIEYVYNFSNTAGAIIVKYTDGTDFSGNSLIGKYSAIYFKELTAATVILGNAYDAASMGATPVEVDSLDAAKEKFKPANMSSYGGELSGASVLTKQQ